MLGIGREGLWWCICWSTSRFRERLRNHVGVVEVQQKILCLVFVVERGVHLLLHVLMHKVFVLDVEHSDDTANIKGLLHGQTRRIDGVSYTG